MDEISYICANKWDTPYAMHTHNLYVKPFRIRKTIDNNIKKTVSKPINQGTSTHLSLQNTLCYEKQE